MIIEVHSLEDCVLSGVSKISSPKNELEYAVKSSKWKQIRRKNKLKKR